MDFLELTASQEHLLMESISEVTSSSSNQISAATKNVATHHEVTSRVLTEKKLRIPNNMVFHNVQNLHVHYH